MRLNKELIKSLIESWLGGLEGLIANWSDAFEQKPET